MLSITLYRERGFTESKITVVKGLALTLGKRSGTVFRHPTIAPRNDSLKLCFDPFPA